jgi:hypothetical protein
MFVAERAEAFNCFLKIGRVHAAGANLRLGSQRRIRIDFKPHRLMALNERFNKRSAYAAKWVQDYAGLFKISFYRPANEVTRESGYPGNPAMNGHALVSCECRIAEHGFPVTALAHNRSFHIRESKLSLYMRHYDLISLNEKLLYTIVP